MGLGKIARKLGKVGALLEVAGYVIAGGKLLVRAVKGDPAARRDSDTRQDRLPDTAGAKEDQKLAIIVVSASITSVAAE